MRRISAGLFTAVAFSFALGSTAPVMAAPAVSPQAPAISSDVIQIQSRRHRGDDRRDRFERRGNHAYYNGRRGYRERRPGYRQYQGFWFPPAAFALGAIIGGAANQPAARLSNAHIRWCQNRWRSYRASDNSYQPFNGPRRACVSPYG